MAFEEIIGRLGLDTSGFTGGTEKANGAVTALKQGFANLATQVAGFLSVATFINLTKEAIDYASTVTDAANATRTSIEDYQVLSLATRDAGANQNQLNKVLIATVAAGEQAAEGLSTYKRAFAALNIDVDEFNKLPTAERLVAIANAYAASGESAAAYNAITEIFGQRAGPKMLEVLQRLASDGFAKLRAEAKEAGVILSDIDALTLDHMADQFNNLKVKSMVFLGELTIAFKEFYEYITTNKSKDQLVNEYWDAARIAERSKAIEQLIEEGKIYNQMTTAAGKLVELQDRYSANANQRHVGSLFGVTPGEAEAVAAIEQRITDNLGQRRQDEAEIAAFKQQQADAAAHQAAVEEIIKSNADALKMLEAGRAAIRLQEMSDKDRLAELDKQHTAAVELLNNMILLGEGTESDKKKIVNDVLNLEKEIAKTKEAIAKDDAKADADRAKNQKDLLELVKQQQALEAQITAAYVNRYALSNSDIAAGGGGSSLSFLVGQIQDFTDTAQRNFDSAARLRAAAGESGRTDADRASLLAAAAEADQRAQQADTRRNDLQSQVDAAQGKETGDKNIAALHEIRDEIKELRDKLKRG